MQQLDSDLWIADSPLRFLGLEIGARMTVVRLPGGKLFLHSPIAPTAELVDEVASLGLVACIIAPNRFHHLFVSPWHEECPEASVFVAPGLHEKRPDLASAKVLTAEPDPGWAEGVDQVLTVGFPLANEVVFFHRPSATLIATDLASNIGPKSPLLTRLAFHVIGGSGRLAPSLLERVMMRDRVAFRRCLDQILAWPFERVVVAHGEVSEKHGREELERGYQWLG